MPLTVRNSARRRRKNPDEKVPERPGESTSAQVMAPTRMKLRVRRREGAGAAGGGQPAEEEERSQESGGRSSRRKNTSNTSTAAAATSSPPTSSASARAVVAAEEASPDSKCPICLDRFNNLAYLDRCLHRFCFPCIQEWSHNKAECPLCKQPFASILHSVRAEDDFKEYTLRPAPANSSVAATVAMVAAMASAARSDHQMRLMLRRHRGADGGETTTRRQRRERGGRGGGSRRTGERTGVWEWYLDSPSLPLPSLPHHPAVPPVVAEDSGEGEDLEQQRRRAGADLSERGVIFEGLTGLGGAGSVTSNDRASRRLMTRLATRQRLQREGGTVRRLRERETVAFRRALYRCGIRVRGVTGASGNQGQQHDITAESFRRNPAHLNRLRPWVRRELTVLYGAHGALVDIVQRIITAQLARHGLEDTPTIEEELRPFLLARTDHFLHELVSFARSPLSLENYDLQAVYEPPAAALELDGTSSPSDSSSVIAISEGEEEESQAGGRSEEGLQGRAGGAHDDVIQTASCLSLSAWDDETPGPSYSTAEPSCSLASMSFSPTPQETANEEGGEKGEEEREKEGEEECLIVGYKKPIAERTPELVQLSSDTEEEEDKEKEEEKKTEKLPSLPPTTPPLSYIPTIPPSTSGAFHEQQDGKSKETDGEDGCRSRARSWSRSSGRSQESVCTLSPSERRQESWRDRKQSGSEAAREKRRRRKRRRRGQERSGTLYNPNRSIYPAMMRRRSHSPSPFHSSIDSGSPLPPSPPDSSWEYHCSPLTSSVSSPSHSSSSSSSSSLCSPARTSSPPPQTPPTPSLSPGDAHHREKPGGKRKYKSRHLDSNDKDPTWRPSSNHHREKRGERGEKERRRRGRDGRRRKERRGDAHRESGSYCGESSRRRCREDRSPSVEIIYEGTVATDAAQPPAHKRRRKRHRKTQHSSSPVIITLDSDSSRDDTNNRTIHSSSSSPLSSQQTVDFSDLPPLPLVHSAGVGGALDAEIGELPVDILDRGSDGSETEPTGRSEGPIAIDNSDDSDRDVDVENVEESGSLPGCNDNKSLPSSIRGPMREVDSKVPAPDPSVDGGAQQTGDNDSVSITTDIHKRNDRLLATFLSDPQCDLSLNCAPSFSPDTRTKRFPCEARSNQDGWSAETQHPLATLPAERQPHDVRDLPTCRTSARPPPPPQQLKEGTDVPPLLKQASPVQSYNRNTPPPLKHKDAGSPRLSPISPTDPHSPHPSYDISSNPSVSHVDSHLSPELPGQKQVIPPISTLKRRFSGAVAAPASTNPAAVIRSSCRSAPIDSHSVRALTSSVHSTSHSPPAETCSPPATENTSPHLDFFNAVHSSEFHSSCDTEDTPSSGLRSSPINLHPVNSLSPTDFHSAKTVCSKEEPARSDSTSGGCGSKTFMLNSCRVVPGDLPASGRVPAGGAAAGSGIFSGASADDTSPAVTVSCLDSRTQSPSSPPSPPLPSTESHSSNKRENPSQRLSVSSAPAAAPSGGTSPADFHPSPKPHGQLPPVDLLCSGSLSPVNFRSSRFITAATDGRLNHTALPSATFHTSHRMCGSRSEPAVESRPALHRAADTDSKHHNHFDPRSDPQFPTDARSECHGDSRSNSCQRDFQLHTDNHLTSSPRSENQWNPGNSDSSIEERSASSMWTTHTHSAT
ncbi:E3 ubiquitin-protein ligase Topors-like [Toxotes jaculatrix]|uniref:E3 ubiquitin-protein ligase Topors-like n=1 Tax=Toxotes jaculatrix TaxID=941984 RepID=UPI001B3AAF37|nr:E3 ubiquitin-protein ligase Topors-like [Toxotes jaculatrix]